MIITRKIQIAVFEEDKELKKQLIHTVYTWRDLVRKTANIIVAHKFTQQNIRDFIYLKDDIQEKFYVKDIINEGPGMSEQNTTYRIASALCKGKVPADIYSCLNQAVANTFKETLPDMLRGRASVRSYRNNIPMPFSAKALSNIHKDSTDHHYYFALFGIPFICILGRDRSNNASIIDSCISGEYKLCSSSIKIDDKSKKMFLLICCDIPKHEYSPIEGKKLYARLDIDTPIVASLDIFAKSPQDSGKHNFYIGNKEEFLYRRMQIQAALRRCQINNRYSIGGHGRKKKCASIEHFQEKELNYITTRLHTYSRMLVDLAVKYRCEEIVLVDQLQREEDAKADNADTSKPGHELLLRNWSYHGLKEKIAYKSKIYGITLTVQ